MMSVFFKQGIDKCLCGIKGGSMFLFSCCINSNAKEKLAEILSISYCVMGKPLHFRGPSFEKYSSTDIDPLQ